MTADVHADRRAAPVARKSDAWNHGDPLFRALTTLAAVAVLVLVLAIGAELWRSSILSRQAFGLSFLTTSVWDPVAEVFGALPFLAGTLVTSLLALVIAVPISLGVAIFLSELSPMWLR